MLRHLYPVAGGQGTSVSITASGTFKPWPLKVWVDSPGIIFKPGDKSGKFDIEIAKDAAPGPHFVRLFNDEGASALRFFIVSEKPDLADKEPNDEFSAPQKIEALPAVIGGKLDKAGDVDSFAVTLKKGQTLTARLEAYVLGSTFDGLLRIVDARGQQFAFNHDGRTLDPYLTFQAPSDGTFVVQTMGFVYPATSAVGFTGGDGCVYRLHLSDTPPVAPFAAETGGAEKEPNDTAPQTVEVPGGLLGRIERPNDVDRFAFTAVKQRAYAIELTAANVGSPLDAWLKVENKDGKELAKNDDALGSRDPRLVWTAPVDGIFTIALGDVTHRGGPDFAYRLSVTEAVPAVVATVATDSLVVKGGKPAELKVTLKRANGFAAKLKVAAVDLPPGVSAAEVDAPAKDGDATLKVEAAADAVAANQPFRVVLRESESGKEHPATFSLLKMTEDNGVPQGYKELVLGSTEQLWLTVVAPKPTPTPAPAPAPAPAAKPAVAPTAATPE